MDHDPGAPCPSSARFRMSPDTLVKSFNDRIALVHMKTRRIHVLNTTATHLWKFICAGNSRLEMQELMKEEFSVDENELSYEIDNLLQMLNNEGLIQRNE